MPKLESLDNGSGSRRGRARRVPSSLAEINVVPLIDVMLVLLIIFMVTAPLLHQGIEVALPKAEAPPLPLRGEDPTVDRLEIGYTWYAQSKQRSAVNTSAKLLLMSHAFDTLGAKLVGWRTDNLNTRSQQAIERLGAQLDGILASMLWGF